jgi:molybdopterin-dependent oxidoreductase alpha subunit
MIKGGGIKALQYSLNVARQVGMQQSIDTLRSHNTCKSCAFGTGGQKGGMRNEANKPLEFCKKNLQSQLSDVQAAISKDIFQQYPIAILRQLSGRELEQLGRLTHTLYKAAGDSHYQTITTKTALEKIAQRFKSTDPQRSFFYASGRSSNEAAFLLQLFARLYGSNHVNNCSYYCHQASGVGLSNSIGNGTATIQLHDLQKADLIFVIGANPASNHPRFLKELMECRRRGGKVIVINPSKEAGLVKFSVPSDMRSFLSGGSNIASTYLQARIGGDIAVLKGIAKYCLALQAEDSRFIQAHTENFAAYQADIQQQSWQELEASSGLSRQEIENAAKYYRRSKHAVFAWGMGVTQHLHGVDNIESIANLALLRGMVGKQGAGLLPLRGHSNVQGVGSMGFTPTLKAAIFDKIQQQFQLKLPTHTGLDTIACLEAAHQGKMDIAFLLGGNLYGASPDPKFTTAALNRIPLKVYLTPTLNTGHVHAVEQEVIILPVRVRDEEKQATTQESMFNYVRISDGGINRFADLFSEVDLINQLARQVINPQQFDFSKFSRYKTIRKAIAKTVTGFAQLQNADETKHEFQVAGRTFHQAQFATTNGKARFHCVTTPLMPQAEKSSLHTKMSEYYMSSIRSEGQFNTIIYEDEDIYRGQSQRWVVLMSPQDMHRESLQENDCVSLYNETGQMQDLVVRQYDIAQGNLLTYFPEANVLIPKATDPRSKTPSYKSVRVNLQKR